MGKIVSMNCAKCGSLFQIPSNLKEAYCVYCGGKQYVNPARVGVQRGTCVICGAPGEVKCTYCNVSLCLLHTFKANPQVGVLACCKECAHTKLYVANIVNVKE